VIVPDTKNWTWVLERPCPECGFDASSSPAEAVPDLIRANAEAWRALLAAGAIAAGRPDESTWSTLEYACHGRDVYRRYHARTALMLTEGDPLFADWDQDATVVEQAYDAQDPAAAIAELCAAAEAHAQQLDAVEGDQWERPGRRSDGASFTVATLARYMVHDPIHHVWDVRRQRP
jgi:hypothetical protein